MNRAGGEGTALGSGEVVVEGDGAGCETAGATIWTRPVSGTLTIACEAPAGVTFLRLK